MNIFLYIILFIMGTIFGSFLTLATYRIPLNQDITHKHSYCPKCNHLLSFFDLIPILSYIFLKGRCRYCKCKISPRYFLIELISGISFVLLGLILKINVYTITMTQFIELFIGMLYIVFLVLIAQIDKEHNYIDQRVLIYGVVISVCNIIFQYLTDASFNLNRVIIYLIIIVIIMVFNIIKAKRKRGDDYVSNTIILCLIINFFIYETSTILVIISTLLIIAIKLLIYKIINKNKDYNKKLPIAYYMCISNALILIIIFIKIGGII